MNMIHKILDCQVKEVGDRAYEFTASTEGVDRDGEVIKAEGWQLENYLKNPVIMYAHNYSGLPVGRASKVWVDGQTLKDVVEFPPEGTYEFADIVHRLVKAGYLKTQSVGFIPREWDEGKKDGEPKRSFTKQELLEISIVPVPSNPDALVQAREAGVITTKQFELVSKPEETENYIRIPVRGEEGKHEGHRIRTIEIAAKEGIKALYCGEDKKVITYLFDKAKDWTMDKAKEWVKEHEKGISQAEIKDELDYVKALISKGDLSESNKKLAQELANEIKRITGGDMPVEIETKATNTTIIQEPKRLDKKEIATVVAQTIARMKGKVI